MIKKIRDAIPYCINIVLDFEVYVLAIIRRLKRAIVSGEGD
jgi:hypothetical protein